MQEGFAWPIAKSGSWASTAVVFTADGDVVLFKACLSTNTSLRQQEPEGTKQETPHMLMLVAEQL